MSGCPDCVAASAGCCKTVFLDDWKIILLPREIKRIAELTGKDPSQFVDSGPLSRSQLRWYVSRYTQEDPIWVKVVSQWKAATGLKASCPFLNSNGCTLPYRDKPFLCRVYPLDFNITQGTIFLSRETGCPVGQQASSVAEVLDYFRDDWESLKQHFMVFRQDFFLLLEMISCGVASDEQARPALSGSKPNAQMQALDV
jgi:Fe-S-cluster containining protein